MVKLYQLEQNSGSLDKSALNAQYNFGSHVIQSGKLNDISKTLDNKLVLQIIDSGAGIDPSDYEKAFEPFIRLNQVISAADQFSDSKLNNSISASRSDSASKQSQEIEGTGLGLSIVKSICEQAGIDVFMKDSNSEILNLHDNRGLCITLIF